MDPLHQEPILCEGLRKNAVLAEIFEFEQVTHPDGRTFKLSSGISVEEANALYRLVRQEEPEVCLEIGMAYGISTLTILTALEQNGRGTLLSVDPYDQWDSGLVVAMHNLDRAGLRPLHKHIRQPSHLALPELLSEGYQINFCYVDGMHTFDYVLVDCFYCDKLLKVGGIMGFDDAGWRSVWRVIRFLLTHRHYEELDVGLARSFKGRNLLATLLKRMTNRQSQNRYFRKLDTWEPPYSYYHRF